MHKTFRLVYDRLLLVTLLITSSAVAEIAPPNDMGVAMGHLHYQVRNIEAERDFWLKLGGTAASFFGGEIVDIPNLRVLIREGQPNGGTEGSVINHVAFRVASLAALEAQGLELHYNEEYPGIASVFSPAGERIELFDDGLATNIGFSVADGITDEVAERHNRPLTAPIISHHMHFYLPEAQVAAAQQWYVDVFGATPGQRWRYLAADLPGINLNFSAADVAQAATEGRALDHIGFEVQNLEAFCADLIMRGVVFDQPYTRMPSGFALAFLTDPWGAKIELTEGLGAF